jgi:hypothetical protein
MSGLIDINPKCIIAGETRNSLKLQNGIHVGEVRNTLKLGSISLSLKQGHVPFFVDAPS